LQIWEQKGTELTEFLKNVFVAVSCFRVFVIHILELSRTSLTNHAMRLLSDRRLEQEGAKETEETEEAEEAELAEISCLAAVSCFRVFVIRN